jgi:hypothetical protein
MNVSTFLRFVVLGGFDEENIMNGESKLSLVEERRFVLGLGFQLHYINFEDLSAQ